MASFLRLIGSSRFVATRSWAALAADTSASATEAQPKQEAAAPEAEEINDMSHLPLSARDMLSGIPSEHLSRSVVIYFVALTAMQSGGGKRKWRLEFSDPGLKWHNPMMGWTSTRDPLSQLRLDFPHKEDAIQYAKNLGLKYTVKQDNQPFSVQQFDDQIYDSNFLYKGSGEDPTEKIFD